MFGLVTTFDWRGVESIGGGSSERKVGTRVGIGGA